jgi:transcriptional regulator with XRE-family HTH domain
MKNNIHIGSLIREKMKERNFSIARFAHAINCSRANIYSIFKRKSMNMEQLEKISKVLSCDFVTEVYGDHEERISSRRVIIIEVDEDRFQEIQSDKSILVINSWKIFE